MLLGFLGLLQPNNVLLDKHGALQPNEWGSPAQWVGLSSPMSVAVHIMCVWFWGKWCQKINRILSPNVVQKSIENMVSKSIEIALLKNINSIDFCFEIAKSIEDWFWKKINRSIDFFQSRSLWVMMSQVQPLFQRRGLVFHCEYVESIRNWNDTLPKISSMFLVGHCHLVNTNLLMSWPRYGGYKRRTYEDPAIAPHSLTWIRRERALSSCHVISWDVTWHEDFISTKTWQQIFCVKHVMNMVTRIGPMYSVWSRLLWATGSYAKTLWWSTQADIYCLHEKQWWNSPEAMLLVFWQQIV